MIRCLPARVSLSAAVVAGTWLSACDTERPEQPEAADPSEAAPTAAIAHHGDGDHRGDDEGERHGQSEIQIKTLGNRADLISGGDALVEIIVPHGTPSHALHVTAGRTDVSGAFSRRADGRILGVITGLPSGRTVITARLDHDHGHGHDHDHGRDHDHDRGQAAALTVTNHPIGGPVLSGRQIQPWVCATPLGALPASPTDTGSFDSGLASPPTDAQCNAPTEFKLYYRTTTAPCALVLPDPAPARRGDPRPAPSAASCFQPFDPSAPKPANLAMTTTDTGVTVPYIVRVERLTLNRGIGDIAVLFDPTQGMAWNALAPQTTWNGKMLYVFGPSTNQPRFQLRSTQVWAAQDEALKRGFLVAVHGMTDSFQNSNRVTMSETMMMMKEHIVDSYGELRYAMGAGCSGGSINQLTMASIFPGLLDGIQPSCTYPDSETTGMEVADCEGLVRFYASDTWKNLLASEGLAAQDTAKQAAINGHLDQNGCRSWFNSFIGVARPGMYLSERVGPTGAITAATTPINNCGLPPSLVYDPVANPTGARCTAQDHAVSIWGTVNDGVHPRHAPSTRDNVGVVYGLKAFLSGAITGEEFVAVNENVGGADFDVNRTTQRSVADRSALDTAYRAGIVMDGRQVVKTPILDVRGFDEQGIHYIWRSFSLRARLDAAGGHGNHVLWRFTGALVPPAASGLTLASFLAMDQWLAALRADSRGLSLARKIVADKPASAFDFCYLSTDTAFTTKITDQAVCDADPGLKSHSSPRQIAGGPITEDILKCRLRSFHAADYPGLTSAQLTRLRAVFSDGVCDWTKPGIGQRPAESPLDFTAGPGGESLPAAPESHGL